MIKKIILMLSKIKSVGKLLKKKNVIIGLGVVVLLVVVSIFHSSFFKKDLGPGSLVIDCAYFRKLSPLTTALSTYS